MQFNETSNPNRKSKFRTTLDKCKWSVYSKIKFMYTVDWLNTHLSRNGMDQIIAIFICRTINVSDKRNALCHFVRQCLVIITYFFSCLPHFQICSHCLLFSQFRAAEVQTLSIQFELVEFTSHRYKNYTELVSVEFTCCR